MKKIVIPILLLLLSLIVAVGSQTFLGACVHEDGGFGACHWAARALLGEGVVLAALAVLALVMAKERAGLYLAMVPTSALGILTPGSLIAICSMDTMRCRMLMKPAMTILCAAILLLAFIGWVLARRQAR